MTFEEYYNLFAKKMKQFHMKNRSLIDVVEQNVNNFLLSIAKFYLIPETSYEPVTFKEYCAVWLASNEKLTWIRHWVLAKSTLDITLSKKIKLC